MMPRIPSFLRRRYAPPSGLDIGTHAIRLVELSAIDQTSPQLERHASAPLPRAAISNDGIEDLDLVCDTLQQLWQTSGTRSRRVVIGIPAASATTALAALDVMTDDDRQLRALAHRHAAHLLPYSAQQACIEYRLLRTAQDKPELLIAATRKDVVEDRLAIAEALGLEVVAMEIDSYAQYAAWQRTTGHGRDQRLTGLLQIDEHGIQLSLLVAARTICLQQPHARSPMPADLLACAVVQLWRQALSQVGVASHDARTEQHHLVLTSCLQPPILNTLRQQLRLQVATPFTGMTLACGIDVPDNSMAYLSACGLAMWPATA